MLSGNSACWVRRSVQGKLFLFAMAGSALAAEPAERTEQVLVLGFTEPGRAEGRLRSAVEERLRRNGEPLIGGRLRARDHACHEEECLQLLGETLHAGRILGGELDASGGGQVVKLWLWDVSRRSLRAQRLVSCPDCSPEQKEQAVALAAGQLLEERPGSEASRTTAAPPPEPPQRASLPVASLTLEQSPSTRRTRYWTPARCVAVGVSGGLTLATFALATSLALWTDNRLLVDQKGMVHKLPSSTAFFGVGGALLGGLALAFAIPSIPGGKEK